MLSCPSLVTVEAMRTHRGTDDASQNRADDFEYECMISKGYVWDRKACPMSLNDEDDHPDEGWATC